MTRPAKLFLAMALGLVVVAFSSGRAQVYHQSTGIGDRWYALNIKGERAGYLRASRSNSGDPLGPIVFEYEARLDEDKDKIKMTLRAVCEDNYYYSPVRLDAVIDTFGEGKAGLSGRVEKKYPYGCSKGKMKLAYQTGNKVYKLDMGVPAHTVMEFAMLEIVPQLPKIKGEIFEFAFFLVDKFSAKKRHKIKYLGTEAIEMDGQMRTLHKFEQKGSGIRKMEYWLDEGQGVVRVLKDNKEELLLSNKAQAMSGIVTW